MEGDVYTVSSPSVAEMEKILENTYRNINIALVNEMAMLCEKMNISMDMDNWQKTESFAATVKQLTAGGSKELQRAVFRMEMSIRKSDYEKSRECSERVKEMLREEIKDIVM